MSIYDVLDIRTLAGDWRDERDSAREDADEEGERPIGGYDIDARYVELCEQLNIDPTPDELERFGDQYEPTLLAEGYFTQYARDLADDLGLILSSWPGRHINWDAAADELKQGTIWWSPSTVTATT